MTWSYSGDPENSDLDTVRFLISDTDEDDQLLQDAEIEYALSVNKDDIYGAASLACDIIRRKFIRQVDYRLGPLAVSASQRAEAYAKLAEEFRTKAGQGISFKEPEIPAAFRRNLMSNS